MATIDDYASMTDDYKLVTTNKEDPTFYSWNEILTGEIIMKKEDQKGDVRNTKEIRSNREFSQEYTDSFHQLQSPHVSRNTQTSMCPICDEQVSSKNKNFTCSNSHKWHNDNGRFRKGHI